MALNAYARAAADRITIPLAKGLVAVGATANWMTCLGMVLAVAGAVVAASGQRFPGALVIAFGAVIDALDGGVARLRGTSGKLGAFYDSVADRIADAAIFGAVLWLMRDEPVLFVVALVALGLAQATSYMRARAESLGWTATVGVMERAERLVALLLGLAFPILLPIALWLLAVGGLVTVGQRLRVVMRQAKCP